MEFADYLLGMSGNDADIKHIRRFFMGAPGRAHD